MMMIIIIGTVLPLKMDTSAASNNGEQRRLVIVIHLPRRLHAALGPGFVDP